MIFLSNLKLMAIELLICYQLSEYLFVSLVFAKAKKICQDIVTDLEDKDL